MTGIFQLSGYQLMRRDPPAQKTDCSNEKTEHISDLVLDCIVLVRLHGIRVILLLRIGGLTLCPRRSRLALLIGWSGGGNRLINLHLCVLSSRPSFRFQPLLRSRGRGLRLFLGGVQLLAGLFFLNALAQPPDLLNTGRSFLAERFPLILDSTLNLSRER